MKHKFIPIEKKFEITSLFTGVYNRVLPKNFIFDGEKHDFWEIMYVGSEKIELTEEQNVYLMNSGDIIFHAPMEFHKLNTLGSTTPHLINLSFIATGELPENLTNGFFSLNESEKSIFLEIVNRAYNFTKGAEASVYSGQEIAEKLSNFIIRLCNNSHSKNDIVNTNSSLTYKTIVELMNHNVLNNITIETLSDHCFVSVSYIKNLFSRYAGISPKTYYNHLRLTTAQKLLAQGFSPSEVSEKMNFSSPNYFSSFFKKYAGTTPLQFKKSINN